MKSIIVITTLLLVLIATPQQAFAADPGCKPLYGGGVTTDQLCGDKVSTTGLTQPQSAPTPTPLRPRTGATTKGGLPVLSTKPTTTTPSTGPELLGLLALFPAGALGYYLRKKA